MNTNDIEIVYMKVRCPKCKRVWGVVVNGKSFNTLPEHNLICDNCGSLTANFSEDKEIIDNEGTNIFN